MDDIDKLKKELVAKLKDALMASSQHPDERVFIQHQIGEQTSLFLVESTATGGRFWYYDVTSGHPASPLIKQAVLEAVDQNPNDNNADNLLESYLKEPRKEKMHRLMRGHENEMGRVVSSVPVMSSIEEAQHYLLTECNNALSGQQKTQWGIWGRMHSMFVGETRGKSGKEQAGSPTVKPSSSRP